MIHIVEPVSVSVVFHHTFALVSVVETHGQGGDHPTMMKFRLPQCHGFGAPLLVDCRGILCTPGVAFPVHVDPKVDDAEVHVGGTCTVCTTWLMPFVTTARRDVCVRVPWCLLPQDAPWGMVVHTSTVEDTVWTALTAVLVSNPGDEVVQTLDIGQKIDLPQDPAVVICVEAAAAGSPSPPAAPLPADVCLAHDGLCSVVRLRLKPDLVAVTSNKHAGYACILACNVVDDGVKQAVALFIALVPKGSRFALCLFDTVLASSEAFSETVRQQAMAALGALPNGVFHAGGDILACLRKVAQELGPRTHAIVCMGPSCCEGLATDLVQGSLELACAQIRPQFVCLAGHTDRQQAVARTLSFYTMGGSVKEEGPLHPEHGCAYDARFALCNVVFTAFWRAQMFGWADAGPTLALRPSPDAPPVAIPMHLTPGCMPDHRGFFVCEATMGPEWSRDSPGRLTVHWGSKTWTVRDLDPSRPCIQLPEAAAAPAPAAAAVLPAGFPVPARSCAAVRVSLSGTVATFTMFELLQAVDLDGHCMDTGAMLTKLGAAVRPVPERTLHWILVSAWPHLTGIRKIAGKLKKDGQALSPCLCLEWTTV